MYLYIKGTNWHEIAYIANPKTNAHGPFWNTAVILYFFGCYIVLGIILCNLLTTLIVEFHKVASEEEAPVNKMVSTEIDSLGDMLAQRHEARRNHAAETDTTEVMVGQRHNWRYCPFPISHPLSPTSLDQALSQPTKMFRLIIARCPNCLGKTVPCLIFSIS